MDSFRHCESYSKFVYLIILFQVIFLVPECHPSKAKAKRLDELIEAQNMEQPVESLKCHVCHSETHSSCHNLTEDQEGNFGYLEPCVKNSTFCLVRKFSFTLTDENQTWPMKTFGIKRNCTAKCEPGCVIMGERTRLYVCNACCQSDGCNVGSGSAWSHSLNELWIWWTLSVAGVMERQWIRSSFVFRILRII